MKIVIMLSLLVVLATANAREAITTGRYIYEDDFLGEKVSLLIDLDKKTIENPQKSAQAALPFSRKTGGSEHYVIDLGAGEREFEVFKSGPAVFLCAADEPSKCRILKPAPPQ